MKKTAYWEKIVLLLFLGWMSIWLYRTMLTPVYAEMQETIGKQTNLKMGMISSIYFFGYTFMQIPGGILMDRIGRKRVMIPGFVLFLAGLLSIGAAHSLNGVYLGSLLAGIGTGTYYSGAFSLTAQYIPAEKKYFATALVNDGCAVGMILGYLGSGYLVKKYQANWKSMVLLAIILVALVILVFLRNLKDDRPEIRKREQRRETFCFRALFTPQKLATYLFYFATCYGYYMIATWLPSFLQTERGMNGSAASAYTSIVALVSIPGALFLGKLLDRFQGKSTIAMVLLQAASAGMLFLLTKCLLPVLLVICLAVYGLCGKQAIDPLIVPHICKDIPEHFFATGLGIFNFFGMSGSILAPGITGYVEDLYGSKIYGFYIACALLLGASMIFLLADWSEKHRKH